MQTEPTAAPKPRHESEAQKRRGGSSQSTIPLKAIFRHVTVATIVVSIAALVGRHYAQQQQQHSSFPSNEEELNSSKCSLTCRLEIVESIPENLYFGDVSLPRSTYSAWRELIDNAHNDLLIAAYKSSLQGRHVLGNLSVQYSAEGDDIFDRLLSRGREKELKISMIENYPPKDKGDNEDGLILQQKGAVDRRYLTISMFLGAGKMHSKFLLADDSDFYLGSANLDWRSLNQKLELGAYVQNCPCLGRDLKRIYAAYWGLSHGGDITSIQKHHALYNKEHPLTMIIQGAESKGFLATSPPQLNQPGRTWDLDAIVDAINNANEFLYIHVMDYFPFFIYRGKHPKPFSAIDSAIRGAVMRGVDVKMLNAALHYPRLGTASLRSLQSLHNCTPSATFESRIFKVPTPPSAKSVINRERRTHKKFLVTETTVIIGNSNWSGDYFDGGTTGAALVMMQEGEQRPLVDDMRRIFFRDFNSQYAHPLNDYYRQCILERTGDFCEADKDPKLFATPPKKH